MSRSHATHPARSGRPGVRHGQGHPTTSDPAYDADADEFLRAIERFKEQSGRRFPTWTEALRVAKALGYRKPPPAA